MMIIFSGHTDWLCFDHGGPAAERARSVFRNWIGESLKSVDEVMKFYGDRKIEVSGKITLGKEGKYYKLIKSQVDRPAFQLAG